MIGKEKVRATMKMMKSGKLVGPENIPVDVWKCLRERESARTAVPDEAQQQNDVK